MEQVSTKNKTKKKREVMSIFKKVIKERKEQKLLVEKTNEPTGFTPIKKKKWEELIGFTRFPTMVDLVKCLVITEKTYLATTLENKYTFDVDKRLTKPQLKKLFETLFLVNIVRINTLIPPKQPIRFKMSSGFKPSYKRVILTLKKGQSINFDLKDIVSLES